MTGNGNHGGVPVPLDESPDLEGSDTVDSVKGFTSVGGSAMSSTRAEACRGLGRKVPRWPKAQLDDMTPEGTTRPVMQLYHAMVILQLNDDSVEVVREVRPGY